MDSGIFREFLKALAAEGALALLIIYGIQARHELRKHLWVTATALLLIVSIAVAGYFEFGWKRYGTFMNNHDFYHYYTGTKYAPELGYYNQYSASLLADHEQKKVFDTKKAVRNLQTHGYTPTAEVFQNQEAIKGRFSPERWEDFKKDIFYFQDRVPRGKWQQMLRDKGYNGTPVWSMVTGMLTNTVSTDSEVGMWLLTALDPLIIALMIAFIWWAFGPWAALFALAFFGTNFVMSFVHIKGALLRMDWVACLVVSMCLLHKKHFKSAGVVLAYAAAARVFPAVFAFGIGALACWDLLATRKFNRDYVQFFIAFFVTAAVMLGLSYLYYGATLWQEFIVKIGVHNNDISTTRVGFKYVFLWPFERFGEKVEGFKAHQDLWWKIQAVMLVITFIAARKMKPYQALGLGFVPAFFLTAPTFYYYVLLIVPLMIFLPNLKQVSHVVGASLFFLSSIAGYALHHQYNLDFPLSFFLSCMYLTICLYILGLHLVPVRLIQRMGARLRGPSHVLKPLMGVAYAAFIIGLFLYYRADSDYAVTTPPSQTTQVAETRAAAPTPTKKATSPTTRPSTTSPAPPSAPQPPQLPNRPHPVPDTPIVEPTLETPDGVDSDAAIRLTLVGDMMFGRNVARDLIARNLDYTYPFRATAPMLTTSDITFGNLECPISGRGEKLDKNYVFNAAPESVEGLVAGGFDVVSLANNHTLDYGTIALEDTQRILSEAGVAEVGIATGDEPQIPFIIERKGIRVGFLAYADHETPFAYAKEFLPFETGPAKAYKESITRDIAALKPQVDVVVVSLHWGIEYQDVPNARQIDLGQFVIDQGAHIVAGHHPHVQQDAAWYKEGLIIYSMGNFVFDQRSRPKTRESRLYTVTVTKEGPVHAQYRPLELVVNDWQPRPTGPNYIRVPRPPAG